MNPKRTMDAQDAHHGGVEVQHERVTILHHFHEEQDPDPHLSEKRDPY
jgi:hypothetical protein